MVVRRVEESFVHETLVGLIDPPSNIVTKQGELLGEGDVGGHRFNLPPDVDADYLRGDGLVADLPRHEDDSEHCNPDHLECRLLIISIMKWLILLALTAAALAADQGDWVDSFLLPLGGLFVRPFYAGYLDIHSGKALYYVYTQS